MPTQLPDIDPEETREGMESFDALVDARGRERARYVMLRLLERAREQQLGVVLGYVLYGAGCMYAAHWVISWG
ncbi:MAG: hypothetical protein ACLGH4_10105, partial [Actinomycetes bacterium]